MSTITNFSIKSTSGSTSSLSLARSIFIHEIGLQHHSFFFYMPGPRCSCKSLQVWKFSDQTKRPLAPDGWRFTERRCRRRRRYWSPPYSWIA
jgi:hypothetical protein